MAHKTNTNITQVTWHIVITAGRASPPLPLPDHTGSIPEYQANIQGTV